MPATYTNVPLSIPSSQRSMLITDVEAGDRIDIEAILGRPAHSVIITPDDSTDVISYKLNSLRHLKKPNVDNPEIVSVWSGSSVYPIYTAVDEVAYTTVKGLQVTSIEIPTIVFGSGGTSISIVVA